jgi:hypothetical protein
MSQGHWQNELRIPAPLTEQLREFRRRVWTIKLAEALAIAGTSVLAAFLSVFVLDRLFDSPAWLRAGVGIAALVGCAVVPWFVHRWMWSFRRLEQLARLLSRKLPGIGDQLLGILELAHNRWEQTRSLSLCQAAGASRRLGLGISRVGIADGGGRGVGARGSHKCVGSLRATLGRDATLHVCSARSFALGIDRRAWRADHSRRQALRRIALAACKREGANRLPASRGDRTCRRRLSL